jgi:hypothetical protein
MKRINSFVLLILLCFADQAIAAKRVALLIGN